MEAKNPFRYALQPSVVTAALIAVAAALRLWPLQALGVRLAWLTFSPAVMVAALYGGFSSGLLGTFLSFLTVLFILPAFGDRPFIRDSSDWLGVAVFLITCTMISGVAEAMRRAQAQARQANERLEAANRKLEGEITERKRAEEVTRKLNHQLQAANKELEAFSYSVSHDLRAPLRHIDGFSQILLEDYAEKLDEEGRGHLDQVRDSTRQMGRLIDDLLGLSRIARAEMRKERVDLSRIAEEVAEELRKAGPEREAAFVIEQEVTAEGDPSLLRVVFDNLLGNAWKFTGRRSPARIEFGRAPRDGATAYFVRDNGAGFDMAYAGKLFGAFQRLHSASEFEGNGVGLTTVQRIIHRHGGRIWAEGVVEQGATFYFTL